MGYKQYSDEFKRDVLAIVLGGIRGEAKLTPRVSLGNPPAAADVWGRVLPNSPLPKSNTIRILHLTLRA
jgi:hypothetical protein